jgi:hypothetical protein
MLPTNDNHLREPHAQKLFQLMLDQWFSQKLEEIFILNRFQSFTAASRQKNNLHKKANNGLYSNEKTAEKPVMEEIPCNVPVGARLNAS